MQQQVLESGASQLALRVDEAATPARASVVIGGAMGVRQDYDAPFAEWLAGQGFRVTTFDYRGSGESLPGTPDGSLRGFQADLFDWASDYGAVVASARAALPQAPLYLLGQSLGAQLPGLLKSQHQVDGLVSIVAGSGYWRDNAPQRAAHGADSGAYAPGPPGGWRPRHDCLRPTAAAYSDHE